MGDPTALEARIFDNPDDDQAWAVYTDWLVESGTPRGRLAAAGPDPARVQSVLEAHPELAPTRLLAERTRWLAREPPETARWDLDRWRSEEVRLDWRSGHIVGARVAKVDPDDEDYELVDLLRELLEHESSRFLQHLEIGPLNVYDEYEYEMELALVADAAPPLLRTLHVARFGREQCEISWSSLGEVAPIWKALPRLEHLVLRAGQFELGRPEAPRLRSLALQTGGLAGENIDAVIAADWPALERLELWFGSPNYGASGTLDHVRRLLLFERMPNVVDLGLLNAEFTDAIVEAVLEAPTRARLQRLDLSMGTLSDAGATRLEQAGRAAFPALTELSVARSYLSAARVEGLEQAFAGVRIEASKQGTPSVYGDEVRYYVSVSE